MTSGVGGGGSGFGGSVFGVCDSGGGGGVDGGGGDCDCGDGCVNWGNQVFLQVLPSGFLNFPSVPTRKFLTPKLPNFTILNKGFPSLMAHCTELGPGEFNP